MNATEKCSLEAALTLFATSDLIVFRQGPADHKLNLEVVQALLDDLELPEVAELPEGQRR